jgi:uncharacterized protein YegJ (DUF2314 family)
MMVKNRALCFLALLCIGSLIVCACSAEPAPGAQASPTAPSRADATPTKTTAAPDSLQEDPIIIVFVVYYLPRPIDDPLVLLETLLEEDTGYRQVEEVGLDQEGMSLSAQIVTDAQAPDRDFLQRFGRGLDRQQADALQDSQEALVLIFSYPQERLWDGLRAANRLASRIASETGGLLWDEETREIFTSKAWDQQRLDTWAEEIPDISQHIVIHAYSTGEYIRAITLGMTKFGLPDIVVEDFTWSAGDQIGLLMNLLGQALAEGIEVDPGILVEGGPVDLDIHAIQNRAVRERVLASLKPGADGVAQISLQAGTREEGDPDNRLIEITFDRYPGPDRHAQQIEMLSGLFGMEDAIVSSEHDEELLAASQRARARLPALQEAFQAGLEPGEYILVKAPFDTPKGGTEWMWVEVTAWEGKRIDGLLLNEPYYIPDLHAGQIVEVDEGDVFDYIRNFADGTREGNETGKILERRSQP